MFDIETAIESPRVIASVEKRVCTVGNDSSLTKPRKRLLSSIRGGMRRTGSSKLDMAVILQFRFYLILITFC